MSADTASYTDPRITAAQQQVQAVAQRNRRIALKHAMHLSAVQGTDPAMTVDSAKQFYDFLQGR